MFRILTVHSTRCSEYLLILNFQDIPCVDDDNECEFWASEGECGADPDYMLVNCKKSCGNCLILIYGLLGQFYAKNTSFTGIDVKSVQSKVNKVLFDIIKMCLEL